MPDRGSIGFGDAFLVQTPTLDRWGQQLYAEQKLAEQRRAQENQGLDAMIQREIGKVRSVDTPEVIKAYQDYKGLKQKILFDKQLQKDPLAYNQAQQAANQAYRNIFTVANGSAEMKDFQKQQATGYAKNPNAYDDNTGTMLSEAMNTPYSQLRKHPVFGDLTNPNTYTYKGSNTNWAEHVQKAMGQLNPTWSKEDVMDGGLQTKITPYSYGNSPGQVKDYLIGAMATHQGGRDAAYQWDHTPEKEIEETIKAYQALPKEYWQRIGLSGPQDLLPKNPDNKAENYASLQAMKYAISNAPREGTPVFRENKAAVMAAQEAKDKRMEAIQHSNAEGLIRLRKELNPSDTEENNSWVENYLDKVISEAKANPQAAHEIYRGKNYNGKVHEIPQDSVIEKAFTRGAGKDARTPDKLYATDDGRVFPVFYKYKKDKNGETALDTNAAGHPLIDEDYGGPLSMDQAKLALGYRGQTKKQLAGTMSGAAPKTNPSRKYQYDGRPITHKQLNDMGYTDDEINDYIKKGLIK
jgi:hypothetical protein